MKRDSSVWENDSGTLKNVTVLEDVPLAEFTTFSIGGPARYFVEARSETDVAEAVGWAKQRGIRMYSLGGGSNLLVPDDGFDGLILKIGIRGVKQDGNAFDVGAGEDWDAFVERTVTAEHAGIECLAGIPGSVGGTPVQNVGAYGQEVAQTITSVRAFDTQLGEMVELHRWDCGFRYRESIFNTTERGRYIVTGVRFELEKNGAPTLSYADLQKRFTGQETPSLKEVADAVREIRRGKGMVIERGDPDTRSAGSFFKNPLVDASLLPVIASRAEVEEDAIPHWPAGEGRTKIAAAWLLERSGFVKGYGSGPVRISSRHTLALTNRGGATFADVMALQDEIAAGVGRKFGVQLEREPVVLE